MVVQFNKNSRNTLDIYHAAKIGDSGYVWRKLKENPEAIHEKDEYGNTCLYYSSLCGHHFLAKSLLEKGARDEPNKRTYYGALLQSTKSLLKSYCYDIYMKHIQKKQKKPRTKLSLLEICRNMFEKDLLEIDLSLPEIVFKDKTEYILYTDKAELSNNARIFIKKPVEPTIMEKDQEENVQKPFKNQYLSDFKIRLGRGNTTYHLHLFVLLMNWGWLKEEFIVSDSVEGSIQDLKGKTLVINNVYMGTTLFDDTKFGCLLQSFYTGEISLPVNVEKKKKERELYLQKRHYIPQNLKMELAKPVVINPRDYKLIQKKNDSKTIRNEITSWYYAAYLLHDDAIMSYLVFLFRDVLRFRKFMKHWEEEHKILHAYFMKHLNKMVHIEGKATEREVPLPGGNFTPKSKIQHSIFEALSDVRLINQNLETPRNTGDTLSKKELLGQSSLEHIKKDSFACHRFFLKLRSIYFNLALERYENLIVHVDDSNYILFPDITKQGLKELVQFLYTDLTIPNQETAVELLLASDYYGVHHLGEIIKELVLENVEQDNVIVLMSIADPWQKLKSKLIHIVIMYVQRDPSLWIPFLNQMNDYSIPQALIDNIRFMILEKGVSLPKEEVKNSELEKIK